MRTININEVKASETQTYSKKDDTTARGIVTVAKNDVAVGDIIVLGNHFIKVVETIQRAKYYGIDGVFGTVGEFLKVGILEETSNPNMDDYIFITARGDVYEVIAPDALEVKNGGAI